MDRDTLDRALVLPTLALATLLWAAQAATLRALGVDRTDAVALVMGLLALAAAPFGLARAGDLQLSAANAFWLVVFAVIFVTVVLPG